MINNDSTKPAFIVKPAAVDPEVSAEVAALKKVYGEPDAGLEIVFTRPLSNVAYSAEDVERVFNALEEIARSGQGKPFPSDNQMMARETLESVRGYV